MKITTRQLKKLIIEETNRALYEIDAATAAASPDSDASLMYAAIKGLGTDPVEIGKVLTKRSKDIQGLYAEFAALLAVKEEEGDLVNWLADDGMDQEAAIVDFVVNGRLPGSSIRT